MTGTTTPSNYDQYLPVKELTSYTSKWVICARVTDRTPLQTFSRQNGREPGKVFTATLVDRDGTAISAKFWDRAANAFSDVLKVGSCYTFSKGKVVLASKKYSGNIPHNYELTFDADACIAKEEADEAIPYRNRPNFLSVKDILDNPDSKRLPFMTDFIGYLIDPGMTTQVTTRNGESLSRRVVTLADETYSSKCIAATLWGAATEPLDLTNPDNCYLILLGCQVREWNGVKTITTLRGTHCAVFRVDADADVQSAILKSLNLESDSRISALEKARDNKSMLDLASSKNYTLLENAGGQAGSSASGEITLGEAATRLTSLEVGSSVVITTVAEVQRIFYRNVKNNDAFQAIFEACPKCNRKVNGLTESPMVTTCRNPSCDGLLDSSNPLFKFSYVVHLIDHTYSGFLTKVFNDVGKLLLNHNTPEYVHQLWRTGEGQEENDNSNEEVLEAKQLVREIFEVEPLWKAYKFTLKLSKEMFNGEARENVACLGAQPYVPGRLTDLAWTATNLGIPNDFFTISDGKRKCAMDDDESNDQKRMKTEP